MSFASFAASGFFTSPASAATSLAEREDRLVTQAGGGSGRSPADRPRPDRGRPGGVPERKQALRLYPAGRRRQPRTTCRWIVIAPGVEDYALLEAVFGADLAAFAGQSVQLASRYRVG